MSSYGQTLTRRFLESIIIGKFYEDYRPDWLFGMELDFFYPDFNLAFEFNGDQHYVPTDFGCPRAQKKRDVEKRKICKARGIKLIRLTAIDLQIGRMRAVIKRNIGKKNMRSTKLTELSKAATKYRHKLIESYDSPSARRRGGDPYKAARASAWAKDPAPRPMAKKAAKVVSPIPEKPVAAIPVAETIITVGQEWFRPKPKQFQTHVSTTYDKSPKLSIREMADLMYGK